MQSLEDYVLVPLKDREDSKAKIEKYENEIRGHEATIGTLMARVDLQSEKAVLLERALSLERDTIARIDNDFKTLRNQYIALGSSTKSSTMAAAMQEAVRILTQKF